MRDIVLARMPEGNVRPVLVLTREIAHRHLNGLTVAPIYSTVRGIAVEVRVGIRNGLDHDSVVSLDNIATIARADLGRQVGHLLDDQEEALAEAIIAAFDLDL